MRRIGPKERARAKEYTDLKNEQVTFWLLQRSAKTAICRLEAYRARMEVNQELEVMEFDRLIGQDVYPEYDREFERLGE